MNLNLDTCRVVANFGASLAISPLKPQRDPSGQPPPVEHAVPLKKLPLLVAGDVVEVERDEVLGSCRIVELVKRSTALERYDGPKCMKAMAANLTPVSYTHLTLPTIYSV